MQQRNENTKKNGTKYETKNKLKMELMFIAHMAHLKLYKENS